MKKNLNIIIPVLILIVLVLFRTAGKNHFKSDSKKWAEPSLDRLNIVTSDKLASLSGTVVIIDLDKDKKPELTSSIPIQFINPGTILNRENLKLILNNSGPVVLFSKDEALSARMWMMLSQMGRKQLYILSSRPDNEVLRYKFHPDTSSVVF